MAKADPGKLRDQAAKFLKKGKLDKALEAYLELEKAAKDDLRVPQKAAEIMLKLGQKDQAIAKYRESAEHYRDKGFLVQAIAIYKVILDLAPDDPTAKEALSALSEERTGPTLGLKKSHEEEVKKPAPRPAPKPEPKPEPARKKPEPIITEPPPPEPPEEEAAALDGLEAAPEPEEEAPPRRKASPGFPARRIKKEEPIKEPKEETESEAAQALDGEEAGIPLEGNEAEVPLGGDDEVPPEAADDSALTLDEGPDLELDTDIAAEPADAGAESDFEISSVPDEGTIEASVEVVPVDEEEELPPAGPEKTPLFSDLEPGEFERVMELLASRVVEKGEAVVKEGESGDSIYIIARGKFRVSRTCEDCERETALLGPSDFFGEIGYFYGKRTATVTALMKSLILEMAKPDLDRVVEEFPRVKEVLAKFYRERVMENLMADSALFKMLVPPERDRFREKFQYREIKPGQVIVKEGDPGDSMFLIKSGEVKVQTVNEITKKTVELAKLKGGDFFGEVSLVKNKPRTATIVAETEVEIMELTRADFQAIAKSHPEIAKTLEDTIEQRVEQTIKKMMETMEK
jgi:CRP-like cAMP-binding protein